MKNKLDKFKKYLDDEQFYDAHEELEKVWFPRRFETSNEVKLLKGFINSAVSFELYKRGRKEQSKKVWANYLKYRQLLFKVDSIYLNEYNSLSRYLENINIQNNK